MNQNPKVACPDSEVLRNFLQGKLEPPSLDQCESHIAECESCNETLRGLNADDTLSQYVVGAMKEIESDQRVFVEDESDSREVKSLIGRLLNASQQAANNRARKFQGHHVEAEVLADRAAEVLRYLSNSSGEGNMEGADLGILGDYRLTRLIGAGSSGVVFHAIDQTLDRNVALKILRPSLGSIARERFISEARSAASIEHQNVVTIYQVGQEDRLAFIAMQWVPGQTLESKLESQERLDEAEINEFSQQVAAGLAAAHKRQLVHRDIKPANLWICEDSNEIKILDFGLARIGDDDPGLTATGMLAGTPNFMSPEQARGLELDGRSDLFSLGCVMYRLLTGRLPFGSPTVLATIQAVQTEKPEPPNSVCPEISEELSDLTMCLLEKQPANRPGSADELINMLGQSRDEWPARFVRHTDSLEFNRTQSGKSAFEKNPTTPAADSSGRFSAANWIAVLMIGLAFFTAPWFVPQIIRIANDEGQLVIETMDDEIEIEILKDGKLVRVLDTKTQRSFNIEAGKYQIEAKPSGDSSGGESDVFNTFDVFPKQLVMKRGSRTVVTVKRVEKTPTLGGEGSPAGSASVGSPAATLSTEDRHDIAPANLGKLPPEPIFEGKPFSYWIDIASRDHHPATVASALEACSQLPLRDRQKKQLQDVFQKLVRQHGSIVVGASKDSDAFHYAFLKVVAKTYQPEEIADFLIDEIDSGTRQSQEFCTWVLVGQPFVGSPELPEKREAVQLALIKRGIQLVEAVERKLEEDPDSLAFHTQILNQLTSGRGVRGSARSYVNKFNPQFSDWVLKKYKATSSKSNFAPFICELASSYHDGDIAFQYLLLDRLFNSVTPASLRDQIFEHLKEFGSATVVELKDEDEGLALALHLNLAKARAEAMMLILIDQHPELAKESAQLLSSKYAGRLIPGTLLEFDEIQKLTYNPNPAAMSGGGYGAGHPRGMSGARALKAVSGVPAATRRLVSQLFLVEPSLPVEFKRTTFLSFIERLADLIDFEDVEKHPEFAGLMIGPDLKLLIEQAKVSKKVSKDLLDREYEVAITKSWQAGGGEMGGGGGIMGSAGGPVDDSPGSAFVKQALEKKRTGWPRRNMSGGGFGGGAGGGGLF